VSPQDILLATDLVRLSSSGLSDSVVRKPEIMTSLDRAIFDLKSPASFMRRSMATAEKLAVDVEGLFAAHGQSESA